jgi:hypothetical protein
MIPAETMTTLRKSILGFCDPSSELGRESSMMIHQHGHVRNGERKAAKNSLLEKYDSSLGTTVGKLKIGQGCD